MKRRSIWETTHHNLTVSWPRRLNGMMSFCFRNDTALKTQPWQFKVSLMALKQWMNLHNIVNAGIWSALSNKIVTYQRDWFAVENNHIYCRIHFWKKIYLINSSYSPKIFKGTFCLSGLLLHQSLHSYIQTRSPAQDSKSSSSACLWVTVQPCS